MPVDAETPTLLPIPPPAAGAIAAAAAAAQPEERPRKKPDAFEEFMKDLDRSPPAKKRKKNKNKKGKLLGKRKSQEGKLSLSVLEHLGGEFRNSQSKNLPCTCLSAKIS